MRCPHCGNDIQEDPRDLCGNCGEWRELHYTPSGAWKGEELGCDEFRGTTPTEEKRAKKEKELKKVRAATETGS